MDDLISEFITETSESLSVLDMELVKLEQNPNDSEILGNIFRLVHTIKGTCGFLGLPRLETVAHAGENVLGKIRDKEMDVTPEVISIVLEALDRIKYLMDHLEQHAEEPEGEDSDLCNRLNAMANGQTAPSVAASAPAAVDVPQEVPETAEPEQDAAIGASDFGLPDPPSEGGLSQDELDALERAFNETAPTIGGGQQHDAPAPTEPQTQPVALETPEAQQDDAKSAKPSAKEAAQALSQQAKDKAIAEGLAATPKAGDPAASNMANQSIRVNLNVLENLMQMVGELVLTRNQLMQVVRNRNDNELKGPLQHLSHITTELQEGVMKTRMQPIGNAWAKFPRLIRDLSIELGKKIELRMVGAETELDRQLLEMIKDPLTHMVRNSCDHGLEGPDERLGSGKKDTGTVTLSAYHEGGHIIIEISDDGRGVNIARIKQKAVENGLATQDELEQLSESQIAQFIFKAGFSTAEKVTSVSGRGVGMDVVRTNIEKIGGTVELMSQTGKGSVFHIKIPLTLAIVSVLLVESGGERFAIPQINVLELVRSADDSEYQVETISNAPVLRLRDKLLPLLTLSEVLKLPPLERQHDEFDDLGFEDLNEKFIVVCRVGGNDFGLIVDRIFDTEEIVVKPVSDMLKDIPVFSGNTILGDGSVIMILDPNGLARATGEAEGGNKKAAEEEKRRSMGERIVSFLLFKAGAGAPKAVPLELVSRLEEINVNQIEMSGENPVIQYRDELMRLTTLSGNTIAESGMCEVIVFTYDNKTVGLVVDQILDIVEAPLKVKLSSEDEAFLGSMVIDKKTTDVVDVGYLLRGMIDEALLNELMSKQTLDYDAHVMLVEDSIFFRKLTVPFLSNLGYRVSDFPSAMEALEALNHIHDIDVIVTDIEMPEIDGFGFSERVRDRANCDHIPIIAFTSTINQQFIRRGQEIGMNDFILKTDRETLIHSIARQLSRQSSEEAA